MGDHSRVRGEGRRRMKAAEGDDSDAATVTRAVTVTRVSEEDNEQPGGDLGER